MHPMTHGFLDELQKLANKDEERVPAKKPGIYSRLVSGLGGAALIAPNIPLLSAYAQGRKDLFHGTNVMSADSILRSERGIDPEFAGQGGKIIGTDVSTGKKARINRYLMGESLNRVMESSKIPMTTDEMADNIDRFGKLMDKGVSASDASKEVMNETLGKAVGEKRISSEQADKIRKKVSGTLSDFGKRVYLGLDPADVAVWGKGQGEVGMALGAGMDVNPDQRFKNLFRGVANAVTYGVPHRIEEAKKRIAYKPTQTKTVTLGDMQKILGKISKDYEKNMKNPFEGVPGGDLIDDIMGAKARPQVVIGASVPTGRLGYLKDFPVVRRVMELNPGIAPSLKDFGVQTFEPGRDLSVAENIPTKNIHQVDVQLPGEKGFTRYKIQGAEKALRSSVLQRLPKMLWPGALATLGGYGVYRSIKPRDRMVPKGSLYAAEIDKKASVRTPLRETAHLAKYIVPGVASAGVAAALINKALHKARPETEGMGEIGGETTRAIRDSASQLGAMAGTTAVGALIGGIMAKRRGLPVIMGRALGTSAGMATGGWGAAGGSLGMEQGRNPLMSPLLADLPPKAREFLQRNPETVAAALTLAGAGFPLAAIYTTRKFYPGTYGKAAKKIKELKDEMAKDLA